MLRLLLSALTALVITSSAASAQEVRITPEAASVTIDFGGKTYIIARNQDGDARIDPEFARTSRPCPPFCITPIIVAQGVRTLGELEVIDFLQTSVAPGTGLLLDTRLPEWFAKGTIPGAVNVPFATLEPSNPYRDQILVALGAAKAGSGWDFSAVKDLALFCNGPWCDQTPRAIRSLLDAGYPPNKLSYYRGGMQVWLLLGLTVQMPNA